MTSEVGFNKRNLESLVPQKNRYRVSDNGSRDSVKGLLLEVMSSGRKYFRFRRFHLGKYVTVSIGQFPNLSVEQARNRAKEVSFNFADGQNPNELKRQEKQKLQQEEEQSITIGELYQAYVEEFKIKIRSGERRQKSLNDADSMWRNHIKAKLEKLRSESFTHADAEKFLKLLVIRTSPAVRNKCLTLLKSIYRDQPENPFSKIKKYAGTKRERVLSESEVKSLLNALEEEKPIYRDVVMMLLLTGQRKGCVFSMEWAEIDYQNQLWLIPTSKMKAKKPHAVPLTKESLSVLERRSLEAKAGEKYVFPAITASNKHIVEKSGKGSFWFRITEKAGLRSEVKSENVTIHDLRRTIASWSVMRGGNLQVTSKLLGHSDISITASTYAHLDVERVRAELDVTTAKLLGSEPQATRLEFLIKEVNKLSHEELLALHQHIDEMI
ncbi:site-specific integrase [Parashewanella spongiae]|uniref:Site-specific integrase n=1 Tax=Parashewanella spongiae TaxID=342950 RepID=A0A3A6TEQ3_9GAMM|nr:site-specific integrase [Parashewanella spongiae]MCL1079694.1 tyrosine-type recombinase/integrase [Parashewanella spongiae]RJY07039.1 site-specific integrase [Parashewanella spongiae]